ncbi:GEN1 (predicted) [Pycnogonum litorale]
MGVKGLWPMLEDVSKSRNVRDLSGKKLAVDLGGWICEMSTANTEFDKLYLRNLLHRTVSLLHHDVMLVFILEGTAPKLKVDARNQQLSSTKGKSPEKTNNFDRTYFNNNLKECEIMLNLLGVACIQSSGEAEALCAHLDKNGIVDGCITEDSDAFLYGARTVYRKFTIKKYGVLDMYCMDDIEQRLNLNRERLISLAVLLGCDYFPKGIPGVGKEKAIKLFKELKTENILEKFVEWKNPKYGENIKKKKESTVKEKHCTQCMHLGTKKTHGESGCCSCNLQQGCRQNSNVLCVCDWHIVQQDAEKAATEMWIRERALTVQEFPCTEVTDEYLKYDDKLPEKSITRTRPKYEQLMKFTCEKTFWDKYKCFRNIFPALISWDMFSMKNNIETKHFFRPSHIERRRNIQGHQYYDVKWDVVGETIKPTNEESDLISQEIISEFTEIYPELVANFEGDALKIRASKQQGVKRKCKKSEQKTVDTMFKSKKQATLKLTNVDSSDECCFISQESIVCIDITDSSGGEHDQDISAVQQGKN